MRLVKIGPKIQKNRHTTMKQNLYFRLQHKNGRIPSPRNPAVYKTNLTNRHEIIPMSSAKISI